MNDANELNPVYLRESVAGGANRQLATGKPRPGRQPLNRMRCLADQV